MFRRRRWEVSGTACKGHRCHHCCRWRRSGRLLQHYWLRRRRYSEAHALCATQFILLCKNETNTLLTVYAWYWALPHTGGGGNVGLQCSDVACGLPGTRKKCSAIFHQTPCLVFQFQFLDCCQRILNYSGWLTHQYGMLTHSQRPLEDSQE